MDLKHTQSVSKEINLSLICVRYIYLYLLIKTINFANLNVNNEANKKKRINNSSGISPSELGTIEEMNTHTHTISINLFLTNYGK